VEFTTCRIDRGNDDDDDGDLCRIGGIRNIYIYIYHYDDEVVMTYGAYKSARQEKPYTCENSETREVCTRVTGARTHTHAIYTHTPGSLPRRRFTLYEEWSMTLFRTPDSTHIRADGRTCGGICVRATEIVTEQCYPDRGTGHAPFRPNGIRRRLDDGRARNAA